MQETQRFSWSSADGRPHASAPARWRSWPAARRSSGSATPWCWSRRARRRSRAPNRDFVPLTVDYRERTYAAGKIPGGFFKREGRPTEKEVLSSRLIDRPIRPLFSKQFPYETQIMATVMSSDQENDADVLALIGASAAMSLSDIPFPEPIAGVRVGRIEGEFVVNPTVSQLDESDMDIVVAGTAESIIMVEGGCREVGEHDLIAALKFAMEHIRDDRRRSSASWFRSRRQGQAPAGRPTRHLRAQGRSLDQSYRERLRQAIRIPGKEARQEEVDRIAVGGDRGAQGALPRAGELHRQDPPRHRARRAARHGARRRSARRRPRAPATSARSRSRSVRCRAPTARACSRAARPRRLAVATLGTKSDEQRVEELEGQSWKSYMLHYNFPPFSVGEVRPIRGPGRREIGHGALAERAIEPVIPADTHFPYTIRIVSDILESNGSSSMATVCAGAHGADGRGCADQGAGGRHRDGADQGRRAGRGAHRHPRRRGPSRRHGLQGDRHPRRRHRVPDGHEDRRDLVRGAVATRSSAREQGALPHPRHHGAGAARRRVRRCRRSRRASSSSTSIPTRSAKSSARAARSSSASPRRPAPRSTSRTAARCASPRSTARAAGAPRR